VCTATLLLLTIAADRGPVLLVVDDAQWIDRPSLAALLFAGRRLAVDQVAMVLAAHDTALDDFDAAHLDVLRVAGLDREATGGCSTGCAPTGCRQVWSRSCGGPPKATPWPTRPTRSPGRRWTASPAARSAADPGRSAPVGRRAARAAARRTRGALLVVALSGSAEAAGIGAALDAMGVGRAG
jgi:hypothetical protein